MVDNGKAGGFGRRAFLSELFLRNVAVGLGKKQLGFRLHDHCRFREKARDIAKLVDNGKSQNEIDLASEIVDTKAVLAAETNIDAAFITSSSGAAIQRGQNAWFDVDHMNFARRSDKPRQLERKITHARSGLEDAEPWPNVGRQNLGWMLKQSAQGIEQDIAEVPGTAMRHLRLPPNFGGAPAARLPISIRWGISGAQP